MADPQLSIVLTMGRVASSSIHRSIDAAIGRTLHIHSLTPRLLAKQVARKGSLERAPRSALDGLEAAAELIRLPGRVNVVTLVREPISRAQSAAFAVLRQQHSDPGALAAFVDDEEALAEWWAGFNDRRPLNWFDQEIRDLLDVDVFERAFPSRGWDTFSSSRCELLVLKSELDDEVKSEALSSFYGVPEIPILRENEQSRSSSYAAVYERFRKRAVPSDAYRALLTESRYGRHFYGA